MDLLLPLLIVLMGGMIFFSNRQRKKLATQQEGLQNSLSVGDVVVMTSGISGTIVDTDDEKTIDLEIAPDVVTTWLRAAVREKIGADVVEHPVDGPEPADAPTVTAGPAVTGGPADTSSSFGGVDTVTSTDAHVGDTSVADTHDGSGSTRTADASASRTGSDRTGS